MAGFTGLFYNLYIGIKFLISCGSWNAECWRFQGWTCSLLCAYSDFSFLFFQALLSSSATAEAELMSITCSLSSPASRSLVNGPALKLFSCRRLLSVQQQSWSKQQLWFSVGPDPPGASCLCFFFLNFLVKADSVGLARDTVGLVLLQTPWGFPSGLCRRPLSFFFWWINLWTLSPVFESLSAAVRNLNINELVEERIQIYPTALRAKGARSLLQTDVQCWLW